MTKAELRKLLFTGLDPLMNAEGFKIDRTQDWFIKETEDAFLMYQVLIYTEYNFQVKRNVFCIEPHLWIHVKKIEEIFLRYSHIKYDFPQRSYTLGNSIYVLAHPQNLEYTKIFNGTLRYYAFEPAHVPAITERLIQIYNQFAKAYFQDNATVSSVDKVLNHNIELPTRHKASHYYRAVKGLIAARLCDNPDYAQLLKYYLQKAPIWSPEDVSTLNNVIDHLEKL